MAERDPRWPTEASEIKASVESYFASSRLHFIGTWRARFRVYLSEVLAGRAGDPHTSPTGSAWGLDGALRPETLAVLTQLPGPGPQASACNNMGAEKGLPPESVTPTAAEDGEVAIFGTPPNYTPSSPATSQTAAPFADYQQMLSQDAGTFCLDGGDAGFELLRHSPSKGMHDLDDDDSAPVAGASPSQAAEPPSLCWWLHIDMDCFFCSVAVAHSDDPGALLHSPVVVVTGKGDYSEVCSPNYPARAKGVRAGMYVRGAVEACGRDVVLIPVSAALFRQCERVWKQVYHILVVASGGDLKAVVAKSCDEAFVKMKGSAEEMHKVGEIIRAAIDLQTHGCQASIGIAPTQTLARMATKQAKPNGLHIITSLEEGVRALHPLPMRELPGIGRGTAEKLMGAGIYTIADVARSRTLERLVGQQRGRRLREAAEGRDEPANADLEEGGSLDTLLSTARPARVSAEKNFAMRHLTLDRAKLYIDSLFDEVRSRVPCVGPASGAPIVSVTLKILIAVVGWTEPKKANGIGKAFEWSKTQRVPSLDAALTAAVQLVNELPHAADRIRGIGVAVALGVAGAGKRAPARGAQSLDQWVSRAPKVAAPVPPDQRPRDEQEQCRPRAAKRRRIGAAAVDAGREVIDLT
eukprot:TRINITY_DN18428_c0_g1_i1.p1 TRINITY_DN18428_c0_g1~~TRINITY_DN18428_c0_g1_i1.p1  ORF type:complete len:638 (+),score=64.11 TRINITY_DN18428_c0_g1_i1:129-2042(+)